MARHKDEDHIVFTSNLLKREYGGRLYSFFPRLFRHAPFRLPLFETPRGAPLHSLSLISV